MTFVYIMSKSIESLKISHIQLLVIEILYNFYIVNSLNIVKNLDFLYIILTIELGVLAWLNRSVNINVWRKR